MDWGSIEYPINPEPAFYVQAPDGRKDWREIDRQATFLSVMRWSAPRVLVRATANAGKRNPRLARKEGIVSGVHDICAHWTGSLTAYIEFKGYDARGRAGELSEPQIRFGNRCVELGIPCACFFNPYDAAEWLREQGFPIAEVRRAA